MKETIYSDAMRLRQKYQTNNPFELLDALNVDWQMTAAYPHNGLKGYCTIINRIKYVRINSFLCPEEQLVVASHEAGHIVCHKTVLSIGAFKDSDIYSAAGKWEREANLFGADFMLDDEEVLDLMHSHGANFFSVAKSLCVPAPFFAFKLYSMVDRGYNMRMPVDLDSTFLAK